jgi:hypothetical protein
VLAQDGNLRLWRSTSAPLSPCTFWAVTQFGMVVQVTHPIDGSHEPEDWLVGTFVMDNTFAADVRDQTDLDQSILFGSALVATSQQQHAAQSDTFLDPSLGAQVLQVPVLRSELFNDSFVENRECHAPDLAVVSRYFREHRHR